MLLIVLLLFLVQPSFATNCEAPGLADNCFNCGTGFCDSCCSEPTPVACDSCCSACPTPVSCDSCCPDCPPDLIGDESKPTVVLHKMKDPITKTVEKPVLVKNILGSNVSCKRVNKGRFYLNLVNHPDFPKTGLICYRVRCGKENTSVEVTDVHKGNRSVDIGPPRMECYPAHVE